MIVRTEAVVLRAFRYGETSLIVTLFTRDRGKIAVLARGARTPKSRFGGAVQPMNHLEVVLSFKPTRTLQTLREAGHVTRHRTLTSDLGKISAGLRMVELAGALMQDEQAQPAVFSLLTAMLGALDHLDVARGERPALALVFFELQLAGLLGFAPRFTREAVADLTERGGVLLLDTGEIEGGPAFGGTRKASRAALRAFAVAARAQPSVALRMRVDDETAAEVANLAEAYLQRHTEDAYPTRSYSVRSALDGEAALDHAAHDAASEDR